MYVHSIVFQVVMRHTGEFTVDDILMDLIAIRCTVFDRAQIKRYLHRQAAKSDGCIKHAGPESYRAEMNSYAHKELKALTDSDSRIREGLRSLLAQHGIFM